MRKLLIVAGLTALMLIPAAAQAGWVIEGSLGKGYMVSKPRGWDQLNLMIAPGWAPLSLVRLQLGFATDFADKSGTKTDFELRPMITVCPPLLPIFGRAILAVQNLRGPGKTVYAYGVSGGVRFGLGPIGVFGEVGALPRSQEVGNSTDTGTEKKFLWEIEGRAGAYLEF
jgi:hypothetical protein